MKKFILAILAVLLVLAGCEQTVGKSHSESNISLSDTKEKEWQVEFETGIYFDKDWDNPELTYKGEAVPTKEIAMEIASVIFKQIQSNGYGKEMVLVDVFFDTEDEIWIVTFGTFENGELVDGGCCSIAIRKKNAEVLRIWFGV